MINHVLFQKGCCWRRKKPDLPGNPLDTAQTLTHPPQWRTTAPQLGACMTGPQTPWHPNINWRKWDRTEYEEEEKFTWNVRMGQVKSGVCNSRFIAALIIDLICNSHPTNTDWHSFYRLVCTLGDNRIVTAAVPDLHPTTAFWAKVCARRKKTGGEERDA